MHNYLPFCHLHLHTTYSALDGLGKIDEIYNRVKELGQTSVAITDHGSMSGLLEAQKQGDKLGIKTIHGCEFYYERENDGKNGHLIVLAKNNIGLSNMMKLHELSYIDNFYKKPRINWEALIKHKEGLIISSACLASTLSQHIMNGEIREAMAWARKFKDEFGEDFYLELQSNTLAEQFEVNKQTVRIATLLGIKTVLTNDAHYVYKADSFAHEVLIGTQFKKKYSDPKRWKFPSEDYWIKSTDEMLKEPNGITREEAIIAMENTMEVSNKCNARFEKGNYLPDYYDIPKDETPRSLLIKKVVEGAKKKGKSKDKNYMLDVQNEINVIDEEGYSGYFLIVGDFVVTARRNDILVGDGRGSGAGSKVAFLTDITRIDPAKYDLLFERFLSAGREPDFD